MPVRPHHPWASSHIQIHRPAPCAALLPKQPSQAAARLPAFEFQPLCSQGLSLRWRTPAHPAEPSWRVPRPPAPASPSGSIRARLVSLASHPWRAVQQSLGLAASRGSVKLLKWIRVSRMLTAFLSDSLATTLPLYTHSTVYRPFQCSNTTSPDGGSSRRD